jgi:predicted nucleic acid-binding protein
MGLLPPTDFAMAQAVLRVLRNNWREVLPTFQIREEAENLIDRFQLRAADALQLAAALKWCQGPPRGHVFLSGDKQLLDAARMIGFHGIET